MTLNNLKLWIIKNSKVLSFIAGILVSVAIFVFRNSLSGLQAYGYVGLFLLNTLGSATLFLPTPLFLTAFTASTFLHPIIVAVVSSLGSAVGEITGYMIGYGSQDVLDNNAKAKKVRGWVDKYGLWTIFVLAAIPNPLVDLAGIVAGATGIRVYKYLLVVWAGKFIKFLVISFAGSESSRIIGATL